METLTKVMIQIIASEIFGTVPDDSVKESITDELLLELYKLSQKHDMAHLVGYSLDKNNLLPVSTVSDRFREQFFSSVFHHEKLEFDYLNICGELEKSCTEFIPLKGLVIKNLYSEPWMRTSSDIDILIHPHDLPKINRVFEENLQYSITSTSSHDVTFITPGGNLVELHFELIEEGRAKKSYSVLSRVWDFSVPDKENGFCYKMNEEIFLLYHIAHMAKHFESGGCGIRAFLDLAIMLRHQDFWSSKAERLIKEADLLDFANAVRRLCDVWFFGKEHNSTTLRLQEYVIDSGAFGTKSNSFAVQQTKSKGKIRYIISRIFLPYEELKLQYPILREKAFLTPVYEICRWFRLIFGKESIKRKKNAEIVKNTTEKEINEIYDLFRSIGLNS